MALEPDAMLSMVMIKFGLLAKYIKYWSIENFQSLFLLSKKVLTQKLELHCFDNTPWLGLIYYAC